MTGAGMVAVERAHLVTRDMDLVAELIRRNFFVQHSGTHRCTDPDRAQAQLRSADANGLVAGVVHYGGLECTARVDPVPLPSVVAVTAGSGSLTTAREQLHCTPGDVFMLPSDQLHTATVDEAAYASVQVPWSVVATLAEEQTGLAVTELRFTATAPISAKLCRAMARTVGYVRDQLVTSEVTEVHPLIAQELTQLTAVTMLAAFPNTTMTAAYLPGPGWVPSVAVHRAIMYMRAHAGQPITLSEIAAAAGVTGWALQHSFVRRFGTNTSGYLRRLRLEHAYQQLAEADPAGRMTVAEVAVRWGWVNEKVFASAYRRRFGVPPRHTLLHG